MIFRSDDGGDSWTRITTDPRPAGRIGGGDLAVIRVDPKNPDVLYSASVVSWKSTDGGKTWSAFRGAPGGDDYQNLWINPSDTNIVAIASDQGTVITVNGGKTFSSWYNQPTAQMYHVNADNAFPYRLCSGQQESGSACVSSRGNDGEITFREWHPVAAEEYGYVTADPLDPDIVYGGKLTRYDRRTTQGQNITPKPFRGQDFRVLRTEPVVFSPFDPHTLYFAANTLWQTNDGGKSWTEIVNGIPANENVNAVREDPERRGLLFAGTERAVYVSFDDGEHWQSLRLNMPASSMRDVIIKGDDLAVATHGRGFWILD